MNKWPLLILILLACAALVHRIQVPHYNIVPIDSFAQAEELLLATDEQTLVLFDVDDTLTVSAVPIFWRKFKSEFKRLVKNVFKQSEKPYEHYASITKAQEIPQLIELEIVDIIADLQVRKIPTLALTALSTGSFFSIPSMPLWRYEKLRAVGIDFKPVKIPNITFTELPQKSGNYPVLYHGILCTNGVSKGKVVGAFLDRTHFVPKRVIFFL